GHPADDVPVRLAAEAVIEAFLVVHVERGRLLAMERAASLPFAAGLLQLGRAPDHAGERDACAQLVEPLGCECHGAVSLPAALDSPQHPAAGAKTAFRLPI